MTTLGLSMIVGGMAFLLSGLIFLLPVKREQSTQEKPFEEAQNEIEFYLRRIQKNPSKPPPGPGSPAASSLAKLVIS